MAAGIESATSRGSFASSRHGLVRASRLAERAMHKSDGHLPLLADSHNRSSFGAQRRYLSNLAATMSKRSELDPLLPHNDSSPEISGYGFSNPKSNAQSKYTSAAPLYDDDEDDTRSIASNTSTKSALSRIIVICSCVILFALVIAVLSPKASPNHDPTSPRPTSEPARTVAERVTKILDETPLFDGHNDLAIFIRAKYKNKIHTQEFKDKFENGGMGLHVDLPRLREGRQGGAFWSAFVGCTEDGGDDFSDERFATPLAHTLQQIDLLHRLQAQYPDFTPARTPLPEALSRFHSNRSLISPISIEGLHQIPQSAPLSTLRLYHSLGVRAATLTWNCHNAFADAAMVLINGTTKPTPYHRGGLTSAGRAVVREMNRLGMLVDLSHTSYWTQKAVLSNKTSAAPVIYTHSSAFALCNHPRNVHDDMLELVKETNSLVMINFSPDFISCLPPPDPLVMPEYYPKNNTLHQIARHVVYVGEKIGYDHVGFGSDFDGILETPRGMEGVDKYPDLVAEMLRMGVSDKEAGKVVGGNLLRVWKDAIEVAERMQKDGVQEGEDEADGW